MQKYTCKCSPDGEYLMVGKDSNGDFILECSICKNKGKLPLEGSFQALPINYSIHLISKQEHGLGKCLEKQPNEKEGNWLDTKVS